MLDSLSLNIIGAFKQFFADHWTMIVAAALALGILGMLLGSLKRLTWTFFTSALAAGEAVVNHLIAKPKAVALAAAIAGLVVPSFMIGWRCAPERVVEKPVYVPVADPAAAEEIARLKDILASTKGEQSGVISQAVDLERRLTAAQSEVRSLGGRIETLSNEKAALRAEVVALTPKIEPNTVEGHQERIAEIDHKIKETEQKRSELEGQREQIREDNPINKEKYKNNEIPHAFLAGDLHYDSLQPKSVRDKLRRLDGEEEKLKAQRIQLDQDRATEQRKLASAQKVQEQARRKRLEAERIASDPVYAAQVRLEQVKKSRAEESAAIHRDQALLEKSSVEDKPRLEALVKVEKDRWEALKNEQEELEVTIPRLIAAKDIGDREKQAEKRRQEIIEAPIDAPAEKGISVVRRRRNAP